MPPPQHKWLTPNGYVVMKDQIDKQTEREIIKDLTVVPVVFSAFKDLAKPKPYKIFYYSNIAYYLPRYYAIEKFGPPVRMNIPEGQSISAKCKFDYLPYQKDAAEKLDRMFNLSNNPTGAGGVLSLPCGYGKCHGRDTEIMMFDGTFKKVQDIAIGDLLMGDDSTSRTVLSLARGREMMYRVVPEEGTSYTVNESHILSLKSTRNTIIDISVKDYLAGRDATLRAYRVPVVFPYREVPFDPYIEGYCDHIPNICKYNSRLVQLSLLAGYIDANGFAIEGGFDVIVSPSVRESVVFVARSLGFAVNSSETDRIIIYGNGLDQIPTKIVKRPENLHQESFLTTRFTLVELGVDDYYGFALDGNHRYLLSDFQVTHNTFLAIRAACNLGLKTLVVVNKEFLMDQWYDAVQKFSNATVGILQQNKMELDNDIVIAMLHSLCLKEYPPEIFTQFGMLIADEAHHLSSEMFCKALQKVQPRFTLGLSATPDRKDGLSHVFFKYIGPLFHREKRAGTNQVIIKSLLVGSASPHYNILYMADGKTKNTGGMSTALSQCPSRTKMIIYAIALLLAQGRTTLVLSSRRDHLYEMKEMLDTLQLHRADGTLATYGYYFGKQGANKAAHKKMLDESAKCDIVLGTDIMSKEGLDIPPLNTLIFATPIGCDSNVLEQAVGRILRKYHEKFYPLVIDIVDKTGNFPNHFSERKKWYLSEDYQVQNLDVRLWDDESLNNYKDVMLSYLSTKTAKGLSRHAKLIAAPDSESEPKKEPTFGECLLVPQIKKRTTSVKSSRPHEPQIINDLCLLPDESHTPQPRSPVAPDFNQLLMPIDPRENYQIVRGSPKIKHNPKVIVSIRKQDIPGRTYGSPSPPPSIKLFRRGGAGAPNLRFPLTPSLN